MKKMLIENSFRACILFIGLSMVSCSHVSVAYENMWDAIEAADIGAIKKFLREGVDLNSGRASDNRLPLMHAALHDKAKVVQLLIDNGADVDGSDIVGNSCLITAAFLGFVDTVEMLIEGGADLFHRNVSGEDVLDVIAISWRITNYYANEIYQLGVSREVVETGRKKVEPILLAAREQVAEKDIWAALLIDRLDLVKIHLSGIEDFTTIVTPEGSPILVAASALGRVEILKHLLAAGADIESRDALGSTSLLVATMFGHEEIAKVLLENDADFTTMNYQGTNLHGVLQLDWDFTNGIAKLIGLSLDEAELKRTRARIKDLIEAKKKAQDSTDS